MDFYRRVELACKAVPCGKAATYGQIALLSGMPGHARQVGYALGHRLSGQDVPAHRIVNCRGILSGAGSFEHPDVQRLLLQAEGVAVSPENRVDLKKYGWQNTMEDAENLLEQFQREGI